MRILFLITSFFFTISSIIAQQVDAAFAYDENHAYFIKGERVVLFNMNAQKVGGTIDGIGEAFPGLPFKTIDATLNYGNGKVYFFSGDQYVRFDLAHFAADPGYPKNTKEFWPGINYSSIDAAIKWPGMSYFFSGEQYYRFNAITDKTDDGYPKRISPSTWGGLPFKSIDAGFTTKGKSYFFSGDQFAKYDVQTDHMQEGYPKKISLMPKLVETLNGKGVSFPVISSHSASPEISIPSSAVPAKTSSFSFKAGGATEKIAIDLSPHKIKSPSSVVPTFQAIVGNNGVFYLGFQQEHDAVIMKFNSSYQRVGDPIVIKGCWLSSMVELPDGGLSVLVGKSVENTYLGYYPNTLYLQRYSPSGKQVYNKYLFGGNGHGPGKYWFDGRINARIATNGVELGIYFEVQKNWATVGEDIHNGDAFIVTDLNGNQKEDYYAFWTASHSNTLQVQPSGREWWTMTIGDAHPYGLQVYNRSTKKSFVPFPPKEDFVAYEDVNSVNAAGVLHYFHETSDGNFFAILGTTEHPNVGVFTKVDPLYLKISKDGQVIEKKWLKVSNEIGESQISVNPMGGNYLIAFGEGNDYHKNWEAQSFEYCVINENGDLVVAPNKVELPFCSGSAALPIGKDRFVWFEASQNGSEKIDLYVQKSR